MGMTGDSGKDRGRRKFDEPVFSSSDTDVRNSGAVTQRVTTNDDTELQTSEMKQDFKEIFLFTIKI